MKTRSRATETKGHSRGIMTLGHSAVHMLASMGHVHQLLALSCLPIRLHCLLGPWSRPPSPASRVSRYLAETVFTFRIGEKFQQWSDITPPLDEILDSITLYWFTDSFPRSIYPYRQTFGAKPTFFHEDKEYYITKPLGYSWHPKELAPTPVKMVAEVSHGGDRANECEPI